MRATAIVFGLWVDTRTTPIETAKRISEFAFRIRVLLVLGYRGGVFNVRNASLRDYVGWLVGDRGRRLYDRRHIIGGVDVPA